MSKKPINTKNAPAPIGPYNQAILTGNMLFISGQICIDPASAELKNGSIQEETHQVMKNLSSILKEAGMSFSNVVKTSIFITDIKQFAEVNQVYESYFLIDTPGEKAIFPARETVEVAALPKFVNVEISMIAVK